MVKKKKSFKKVVIISVTFLVLIILSVVAAFYFFGVDNEVNFEIDRLFIRNVLKQGGGANTVIKISNRGFQSGDFLIDVHDLEGFIRIDENRFSLGADQEKDVEIIINAGNETTPGIYLGNIEIYSNGDSRKIPVTLEVQSEDILFSSSITLIPSGSNLVPGQKLNSEIKIFNLENLGRSNVKLTFFVKDFEGRTINSESEEVIVEGSSIGVSKALDLPSNLRLGDYSFGVITEYDGSVGTSSRTFKVVESIKSGQTGFDSKTLLIVVFVFGFFFMVFLILLIYSIFYRDKLLVELQNQYKGELRRQRKLIEEKRTEDYSKLGTAAEKKEYLKEVSEIKRLRLGSLKEEKKKKEVELKKIRKTFKGGNLKIQLKRWQKQGYDTGILEQKYKMPNVNKIKKKIGQWQKQGYDTSVLEKKAKR